MIDMIIGLVAIPSRMKEIGETLDSIKKNRPDTPVHVFIEPMDVEPIERENVTRHINTEQLGCFANHANAIDWLSDPANHDHEYVILSQEDFVFADDTASEIERFLDSFTGKDFGFLGLYTSPKKAKDIYKQNRQEINFGYGSY